MALPDSFILSGVTEDDVRRRAEALAILGADYEALSEEDASQLFRAILLLCKLLYDEASEYRPNRWESWGLTYDYESEHRPTISMARDVDATLVTIANENTVKSQVGDYAATLKKMTCYSPMTVLSLPGSIDFNFFMSGKQFEESVLPIIIQNNRYRELVRRGICVFLPRKFLIKEDDPEGNVGHFETVYVSPLLDNGTDNWLRLNGRVGDGAGLSDIFLYKNVLLPYFPAASLPVIARLRADETEAFARFNHFLRRKVAELASVESRTVVDDIFAEIDYGVAELMIEAKKVAKSRVSSGGVVGAFSIGLAVAATSPSPTTQAIAAALGSSSAVEVLRSYVDRKGKSLDIRKSDFYIPYLLSQLE
jgi:hypothetical protein